MQRFQYEIKATRPNGIALPSISRTFSTLSATRAKNSVGAMALTLPLEQYDGYFEKDTQLEIWEAIDGGALTLWGDTAWLVDVIDEAEQSHILTIQASDLNTLLDRRIIAYAAASAQAIANGPLDNEMKAIVRENLSSLATDTLRQIPAANFAIQGNQGLAPTSQKRFAWRNKLIEVLRDLADDSAQLLTPLYFDIVYQAGAAYEFRTYPNYRGTDRREGAGRVLIGPTYGNVANAHYVRDWRNEVNAAYTGGQGDEDLRLIGKKIDITRINTTFARREHFFDTTQEVTQAGVDAAAQAKLYAGRPLNVFTGDFIDTPQVRFNRDVFYGDVVRVDTRAGSFDCHIDSVTLDVGPQGRIITAGLRSETYG